MQLSPEHQALVHFFAGHPLPIGTQHINEYSVFLDLSSAVNTNLERLHSDVETGRQSAARMLMEVKNWLEGAG